MSRKTDKEPDCEEVLGYLYTHVDCPNCGEQSEIEGDASSDNIECDVCGGVFKVYEVR